MIQWLLILLFAFLAVGVPVSISLGLSSSIAFYWFTSLPLMMVAQKLFTNIASVPLMAVPFFILAADLMRTGGVARRLTDFAIALVGEYPGGLAIAGALACAFFAAISGSSAATVVAIGGIMIPATIKAGYDERLAVGPITTAGALGILIPPSIPMIIYGFVTETSIPKLFIAGIVPGVVLAGLLMGVTWRIAVRAGYKGSEPRSLREKARAGKEAFWALLLPVIIVVGIYGAPEMRIGDMAIGGGGLFTPTEASIVAVVYAFVIGVFVYKELRLRDLPKVVTESSARIGNLMLIITTAIFLGFLLASEQVPLRISELIIRADMPPWMFLMAVNVVLILAGCIMDAVPIIAIFVPILFPAAMQLGIDPIHLGVIVVVNLEFGTITPPIGLNLYMASGITRIPVHRVVLYVVPWSLAILFTLLLVTYFSPLSTGLPQLLWGARY